jgi:hypothetical protein
MEKDLVRKAERLAKKPSLALPKTVPPCAKDPFEKVLKRLERIARFADDEDKLKRLASTGDQISRAFAGTLMLGAAGKAPYLANIKLPQGEVFFAMRGKAKKEKLAGMQWFDHPEYRLLLWMDMAIKRPHFHFYSTKDSLYCSCKAPNPPPEYVAFALQQPRANLTEAAKGVWTCPHVDAGTVKEGEALDGTYLRIRWVSTDIVLGICRRCARSAGGTTLGALNRHMAIPSLEKEFEVSVIHRAQNAVECPICGKLAKRAVDPDELKSYFKTEIDDITLIDRHMKALDTELKEGWEAHFLLDGRCFGDDAEALLDELNPSDEEHLALEAILTDLGRPLVLQRATPSKVLAELWEDHGEEALLAVVGGDEELMDKYMAHPEVQSNPSQVLKRALIDSRQRTIISRLPTYGKLPAIAKFADKVARTYKTEGTEGALKTLDREKGMDTRIKSVAYSFLLVLGKETAKKWQYDKTEMEFAAYLLDKSKVLLEAEPEAYHDALQGLLSATGSTERIPEPEGQ